MLQVQQIVEMDVQEIAELHVPNVLLGVQTFARVVAENARMIVQENAQALVGTGVWTIALILAMVIAKMVVDILLIIPVFEKYDGY